MTRKAGREEKVQQNWLPVSLSGLTTKSPPLCFFSLGKLPKKVGHPGALALSLANWKEDGLTVAFRAVKLTRGLPCGQWGDSRTGYSASRPPPPPPQSHSWDPELLPSPPSAPAFVIPRAHVSTELPRHHCQSQWCHWLFFPGIQYVGPWCRPWARPEGHLLESTGSFLTPLVWPAGGRRHPWNLP